MFRSRILSNTSSPEWKNEEWIVRNIPYCAKLLVRIYTKNDIAPRNDFIGQFTIANLINYEPPVNGHDILDSCGQFSGCFHLSIQANLSSDETKQLPRYTSDSSCRYFCNISLFIGQLTLINTERVYPIWKINLKRVSSFFSTSDHQNWNRKSKSAKAIFGSNLISFLIRTCITMTHKKFYELPSIKSDYGSLNDADDLWKIIFSDKTKQKVKLCVYTYVIDNHSWIFSPTGKQVFTNFASKHSLLANCSKYVCYAGEFHPRPKHGWDRLNDEWELVFDNGSFTYAPNANLLGNLKELLKFNFPGLNVVTYDSEDPSLRESLVQLAYHAKRDRDG